MQLNQQIKIQNNQIVEESLPIDNQIFYTQLPYYSIIFTIDQNTPIFLSNRKSTSALILIIIINVLGTLQIISLWHLLSDSNILHYFIKILFWISLVTLVLTDVLYLLTMNINPGIRNLTQITNEEFEKEGKQYCIYCENYKTYKMYHCRKCGVCIQNFDHHCQVLNRCIGGSQKIYFNGFILSLGITFFDLLICGIFSIYLL